MIALKKSYKFILYTMIILLSTNCFCFNKITTNDNKKIYKPIHKSIGKETNTYNSNIDSIIKNNILFIASQNKIYAIKKNKILWKISLKKTITSGIGSNHHILLIFTTNKQLFAINHKNKSILWKIQLEEDILSPPKITNNTIYINTYGDKILAYNLITGKNLWCFSLNNPNLSLYKSTTPICSKNHIYNILSNGLLITLDKTNGNLLWKKELFKPIGTTEYQQLVDTIIKPIIYHNILYVYSTNGEIAAIKLNTKDIIWQNISIKNLKHFILHKNNLFITTKKGKIIAINKKNGSILWENKKLKNHILTEPLINLKLDKIIIGDNKGKLHFIDKKNGDIIKTIKLSTHSISKIIGQHNNNNLYLILNNKKLVYINLNYLLNT